MILVADSRSLVPECREFCMRPESVQNIRVIDSHTGGEPTRVLYEGLSDLEGASMKEKRSSFSRDYEWLRTAIICEPRGFEAIVGALLTEPENPGSGLHVSLEFPNAG